MVKLSNNGPGIVGYGWELGRRNVAATAGQTPFGSRAARSPLVPQQVCGKATVGALGGGGKKMGAGKKNFYWLAHGDCCENVYGNRRLFSCVLWVIL